jgi:hypothetical protein
VKIKTQTWDICEMHKENSKKEFGLRQETGLK